MLLGEDYIKCSWRTEAEGDCPRHLVVFRNGHIFKFIPFHKDLEVYNMFEIYDTLKRIKDLADVQPEGIYLH